MDDAHAASSRVAAVLKESRDAGARLDRRQAVQIEPALNGVIAALQPSQLAPIDAWRNVAVGRRTVVRDRRVRRRRRLNARRLLHSSARIGRQPHDILHRALEFLVRVVRTTMGHKPS
jgi:hypothetical protein